MEQDTRVLLLEEKVKDLENKVKQLKKSNRNWRRKVQRLRNAKKKDAN